MHVPMSTSEIPLSKPDITDLEVQAVATVLRSGRLSIGPAQEQFEALCAARAGRLHGVACSSGTSGLHMALLALGVGPGDEVITTPFSFVASANVILMAGARPVFVDICPRTLNMDPALVERAITPRTKAVLAVEALGNPAHMDAYEQIASRHEIPLIEDCCEALGTTLKGRPCGSFGRAGVFAFYPNKQITTGEGGVIVTDDKRLADTCRSLRSQGRPTPGTPPPGSGAAAALGTWLSHERLGYNYRLSELHAALGVAQMRRLDEIIAKRRAVADRYVQLLAGHADVVLPTIDPEVGMSWFVFVVRLATAYTQQERDRVIDGLRRHDVGCATYFPCIHTLPFYRALGYAPGDFPIAESVSSRTIALPFFNTITQREQEFTAQTLELMLQRENLGQR